MEKWGQTSWAPLRKTILRPVRDLAQILAVDVLNIGFRSHANPILRATLASASSQVIRRAPCCSAKAR